MTAKRFRTGKGIFEEGYPSETIIDNETEKIYYKGYADYNSSKELCRLLNKLHEENIVLKQEVELLRSGLEAYEDNLPVYLTCKEVNDFHSDIYDFKKKQQSFYNEHPNRCKIFVNGVELK